MDKKFDKSKLVEFFGSGIGVLAVGEDFSPCRLRASSTRSTAQMRTPFACAHCGENPLFCHKEKKNRPSGDGSGIGVCCSGIVLCVSFRFTCRDCYLPLTTQIRAVRVCEPQHTEFAARSVLLGGRSSLGYREALFSSHGKMPPLAVCTVC